MTPGIPPRALLAAVLLFAALPASAQVPVPPLAARVTDLTATLTPERRAALEQKLAALEARKGSQVAVLLVPTVQPETIEQYAIRVFDRWKLGRKGVNDGVLLVVAKNDRKLRIEVGYGLEGAIPDAYAKRIIEEEITPRFRQGDFAGGIEAGADRIAKLIDGEAMPPPRAGSGGSRSTRYNDWLPFGLVVLMMTMGLLRTLLGRALGGIVAGTAAGIIIYMLSGIVFIAVIFGLFFFFATTFASESRGGGTYSGGGWSSGGGSWSSGGGFSGGGGSSGGGGASGSW